MIFILDRFTRSAFGLATAVKEFAAVAPQSRLRARAVDRELLAGSELEEIGPLAILSGKHKAWHVDDIFSPFCLAMSALGLLLGRTVILCPHGMLDDWAMANGKSGFKRIALNAIDTLARAGTLVIHALNPDEARQAARYLPHAKIIEVIPNGVPSDIMAAMRGASPRGTSREGAIVVGCMSRIAPKKNQLAMVELAARLRDQRPDVFESLEFRIDGQVEDSAYAEQLVRAIEEKGLSGRVTRGGDVQFEHRANCLSGYDIFFFPSKSEGMPYVVLEAMALGVQPLVADTACCGFVTSYGGQVYRDLDEAASLLPASREELDALAIDRDRFLEDFDSSQLRKFLGAFG